MIYLTVKDTDLIILSLLEDGDLENICETNQAMHYLCLFPDLWFTKLRLLYSDFPRLDINGKIYKALYYKLKYDQWTDIVVWTEHNHINTLSNWIILCKNYYIFVEKYVLNYSKIIEMASNKNKKLLAINLFKFVYTHRYRINLIAEPDLKITMLNALDRFVLTCPYYKEIFELFKTHLTIVFEN